MVKYYKILLNKILPDHYEEGMGECDDEEVNVGEINLNKFSGEEVLNS